MMIRARLRLVLAILAMVLVPLWAPARPAVAMAVGDMAAMVMPDGDCADHGCGPGSAPTASHSDAACALGCLQAHFPPLLLLSTVVSRSVVASTRVTVPTALSLASHHPLPPERPPRA